MLFIFLTMVPAAMGVVCSYGQTYVTGSCVACTVCHLTYSYLMCVCNYVSVIMCL